MSLLKWIYIPKRGLLLTSHFSNYKFERKIPNPLQEELFFYSLWELWAWDHREVDLIGSRSGRPWFAVIFGSFRRVIILSWAFPILSFWLPGRALPFFFFWLLFCVSFWYQYVRRQSTSVPLHFCMLALLGCMGMSICCVFLWVFGVLDCYAGCFCIQTLNPNFIGYLGFLYLLIKRVLILLIFVNVGFWAFFTSPLFACNPIFLGISWHWCQSWTRIIHEEYNLNINISSCIGIHVKSVLPAMCSIKWFDT